MGIASSSSSLSLTCKKCRKRNTVTAAVVIVPHAVDARMPMPILMPYALPLPWARNGKGRKGEREKGKKQTRKQAEQGNAMQKRNRVDVRLCLLFFVLMLMLMCVALSPPLSSVDMVDVVGKVRKVGKAKQS